MASLGALVIELAANTARLSGDLGRANQMIEGFARRARAGLSILGVGVGAGLFANLAKEAIELGDELQKGASRAGIAAGTFSQLAAAAKQTDVDIGTLSKGLKNMQVAVSTAAQGGKEAQSAFRQLGINLDEIRQASPDEQLKAIADALKRVPDPAERARLGTAALGKAYLDLVPLLEQGANGISQLVEEQKRLGNTFSDEQIKKLSDTDDSIKKLKASFTGLATTLTAAVAPALTAFFDSLTGGEIEKMRHRVDELKSQLSFGQDTGSFTPEETSRRRAEIADLERQLRLKGPVTATHSRGLNFSAEIAEQRRQDEATFDERVKREKELQKELEQIRKAHINDKVTDAGGIGTIDPQQLEDTRGEYEGFIKDLVADTQRAADDVGKALKKTSNDFAAFADEAARGTFRAFEDFFFDPFKNGLKGLALGILDVIRHALAAQAALSVLKYLGSFGTGGDNEGKGGKFGEIIGTIFGGYKAQGGPLQQGKWYVAGEKGPEPIWGGGPGAFAMGYGGGAPNITINQYMDNRGATQDLIAQLPAALQANNTALKADILDTLSRQRRRG